LQPGSASRSDRLKAHRPANFGLFAAGLAILLGAALTPTPLLTALSKQTSVQGDQIAAMEGAGKALAQVVPPGALVYWQGSLSTVPLLSIRRRVSFLLNSTMAIRFALAVIPPRCANSDYGMISCAING